MTDERRALATQLLVMRVIRDRLSVADAELRRRAREVFDRPGVRDIGLVGDDQIGSAQLTKAREAWTVTDPAALLAWVKDHAPDEVVTVEQVRSSYITAILARAKADGAAVDPSTGELIPGIDCRTSEPTLTVKPSSDAQQVIAQAFADGVLSLDDLTPPLAIEGGE